MPNVPNLPGVPSLSSYAPNGVTLLLADAIDVIVSLLAPQWGIYDEDGVPVLYYDNQVSFGYSQEWSISTYPVEGGTFQTYNKVQQPSEIKVRFSAGASALNRQAMLQSVDAVMSTTDLYDVVTPEVVYLGYNFSHRDYDREAASVGLVVIDLYLTEVIETASAQFQATQSPAVAGQVSSGNVPVTTTAPATQAGINNAGGIDGAGSSFVFGGT